MKGKDPSELGFKEFTKLLNWLNKQAPGLAKYVLRKLSSRDF